MRFPRFRVPHFSARRLCCGQFVDLRFNDRTEWWVGWSRC
jgi:hypothetical protein